MTTTGNCPLCHNPGDGLLWQNAQMRVISAADPNHPGFTRVIWRDHVKEMTDLSPRERQDFMEIVWQVEQAQRQSLNPDKINLAQFGNMVPHLHWHIIPRWQTDSHFPEAIWACAPPRTAAQIDAWQEQKSRIDQQIAGYHARLIAMLPSNQAATDPATMPNTPDPALAQNTLDSPLLTHLQNLDEVWKETLRMPEPKAALRQLSAFLAARLAAGAEIYPRYPFRALDYVQPDTVRVVILGQDPYHGPNQAQGLAFSVPDTCPCPPSLQNMFKELALEYPGFDGARNRNAGGAQNNKPSGSTGMGHDLSPWAEQGVLLLNTVLTVEARQPASHARQGWEAVTDALISRVARSPQPKVFMLWGSHAQAKRQLLPSNGPHLILASNHPSPLSALRPPKPFIGCNHFKLANEWLIQ